MVDEFLELDYLPDIFKVTDTNDGHRIIEHDFLASHKLGYIDAWANGHLHLATRGQHVSRCGINGIKERRKTSRWCTGAIQLALEIDNLLAGITQSPNQTCVVILL
ncbi:unannotated protein [freshwater metagenome]|uniref:Unannotated protein n=1 Tax=freshwater metagenome TaxID=449393 RepID=A0A6J6M2T7_9ZZZZ